MCAVLDFIIAGLDLKTILLAATTVFAYITLHRNVLQNAKLSFTIHDRVMGFSDPLNNQNPKAGILTGITIENSGARAGLVEKIKVSIVKIQQDAQPQLMEWDYFYDEKNTSTQNTSLAMHTEFNSYSYPVAISGKSSETKFIRFLSKNNMRFEAGNYNCTFIFKCNKKEHEVRKQLVITQPKVEEMRQQPTVGQGINCPLLEWI